MKFTLIGALCLLLAGCDYFPANGPGHRIDLDSIIVYYPAAHLKNVQKFRYEYNGSDNNDNWELMEYYSYRTDSLNGQESFWEKDDYIISNYKWAVAGKVSETIASSKTSSTPALAIVGLLAPSQNGQVDSILFPASGNIPNEYYNAYEGNDTVYLRTRNGGGLSDEWVVAPYGDNEICSRNSNYTFTTISSPMCNHEVSDPLGYFFFGSDIASDYPDYGLQVDLFSRYLPYKYTDEYGNNIVFSWSTDSKGKVFSGTAVNLHANTVGANDTAYISFAYLDR